MFHENDRKTMLDCSENTTDQNIGVCIFKRLIGPDPTDILIHPDVPARGRWGRSHRACAVPGSASHRYGPYQSRFRCRGVAHHIHSSLSRLWLPSGRQHRDQAETHHCWHWEAPLRTEIGACQTRIFFINSCANPASGGLSEPRQRTVDVV